MHKFLPFLTFLLAGLLACSGYRYARAQSQNSSEDLEWLGKRPAQRGGKKENHTAMTGSLTQFINRAECGLNFKAVSAKLTNRQEPFTAINAELNVAGVQSSNGVEVLAAYLYWIVEGNNENGGMVFSGPQGTYNLNGTLIGKWKEGKCWRCDYTMHYRANVTDMICKTSPDGEYQLSGYPSSFLPCPTPPNCAGGMFCPRGDTDGATLLIIYKDYAADYYGSIRVDDGCVVHKINQPVFSHTMNNIEVCEPAIQSSGFMVVGDFQANGTPPHQVEINNQIFPITPTFYNYAEYAAGVTAGQTSVPFGAVSGGDCYSVMLTGVYTQTRSCPQTCQPQNNNNFDITNGKLDTVTVCEGGNFPPEYKLEDYSGSILRWEFTNDCVNGIWEPVNHAGVFAPVSPLNEVACARVVTLVDGCIKYSKPGKINYTDRATPGAVTGGGAVCAGAEGPRLQLAGYVGDVQFWESSEAPNCLNGGGPWTRINRTSDTYRPPQVNAPTCYRALVKDGQCSAEASEPAYITIRDAQQQGRVEGDNAVCEGARPSTLRAVDFNGDVLRWESSELCDPGSAWKTIDNPRSSYRPEVIDFPTCFRAIIQEGSCEPLPTPPFLIDIVEGSEAGRVSAEPTTVCEGENTITLTLEGFRGNIERWEFSTDGFVSRQVRSGQNPLVFENLRETSEFRAVVQAGSCPSATTEPIEITVIDNASAGRVVENQTICSGARTDTLRLIDYSGNINFWELSTDNGQTWQNIGGAGTDAFVSPPLFEAGFIRAKVSTLDCPPIPSATAVIQVKPGAQPGFVVGGGEICLGDNAPLLELAGNAGEIMQWESKTAQTEWAPIDNTALDVYQPDAPERTTFYRALVQNNDCPGVYAQPDSIVVWQPTAAGTIAGGGAFCEGERNIALSLTGQTGSVTRWERSGNGGTNWTRVAGAAESYTVTELDESARYRAVVQNGSCAPATTPPALLRADAPTIGGAVSGGVEVCAKELNENLTLTGQRGAVIRWESRAPGSSWQAIDNQSTEYFVTTLSATTEFRAVVKNGACPEQASASDEVTLIPPSVGGEVLADQTICRGERPGTIELSGYEGDILGWQFTRDGGANWRPISGPGVEQWRPMYLTVTTLFRARVKKENCPEATSDPVTATVVRAAEGGYVTAPYTTVCSGAEAPELSAENYSGNITRWEQSPDGLTWTYAGGGGKSFWPGELTQTTYFRAVASSNVCGTANSYPLKMEVLPSTKGGQLSGNFSVCKGGRSGLMELTGQRGRVLRWEQSEDLGKTWQPFNNNTESYTSPPMFASTWYRAVVQNGNCPEKKSSIAQVWLVDDIAGGYIEGPGVFCEGADEPVLLNLKRSMGVVVRWETTTERFWHKFDTIPNTDKFLSIDSLDENRRYRAVVKSGICGEIYSKEHTVNLSEQPSLALEANAGCANLANIYAEAQGGVGFHTFSLAPEKASENQTGIFENVPFDIYDVTVEDENGCSATETIDVNLPVQTPEIDITSVGSGNAIIRWDAVPGEQVSYEFYYRVYGAQEYERYPEVLYEPYVVLTKLQHSAVYEVYVEATCGSGKLRSKENEIFETKIGGYCDNPAPPVPGGIYISAVTASTAWLHWSVIPGTTTKQGYIIAYGLKSVNPRTWPQFVVCNPTDAYFIQNLVPGMEYGVRVRTNCTNCTTALRRTDKRSEWSPVYDFKTLGFFRAGSGGEQPAAPALTVYPNPNNGAFEIKLERAAETASPATALYDLSGKKVRSFITQTATHNDKVTIEARMPNVPPGVYLLVVTIGERVYREKIIVE